jgi:single-stranded-DNA-specific exonuclease
VPRINAAGRIADAELAITLMLEGDPARAEALAEELEAVHERRRELTKLAVDAARLLVERDAGTGPLLVRDDAWAPGLVGLVAGRLSDSLARPVAAATLVGDEVRGSVRAPADFHVASALEACAGLLTKRGGHAAAGGFSLLPASWSAFSTAFSALPRPYPTDAATESERPGRAIVDLVLPARLLDWALAEQLERLAPYGPGHVEPVLAVTGMVLTEARRVGATEQHVALRMRRGLETFDAIAFGLDAERALPEPGDEVDLVGTLERDDFNGMPRLRLRVVDFAHRSASPLLARRLPPVLAKAG